MLLNIKTTEQGKTGNIWFLFDVAEPTLAAVCERLRQDGVIIGERVDTHPSETTPGARRVYRRTPYIVGREGVTTIAEARIEIEA